VICHPGMIAPGNARLYINGKPGNFSGGLPYYAPCLPDNTKLRSHA
jgi:hypothetical protein